MIHLAILSGVTLARATSTAVTAGTETYRFLPHHERPDDASYAGRRTSRPINRMLVQATHLRRRAADSRSDQISTPATVPMIAGPDAELTSFARAVRAQCEAGQGSLPRRRP